MKNQSLANGDKSEKPDVPVHIGYIVDGNRRWAKQHGLPTYEGHLAGYNALQDVLLETLAQGVKYASAYVFSTENWKRSEAEVGKLMGLLLRVLKKDVPVFINNNVRLRVIGTREGLSDQLVTVINEAEAATAHLTGGELLLCLNYGGQLEIVDAVREIIKAGTEPESVDIKTISDNLYATDIPPCDVIVRTGGEKRLSNFMLWRSAYSELIFLEKYWPAMTKEDVSAIINEYKSRNRRFGG